MATRPSSLKLRQRGKDDDRPKRLYLFEPKWGCDRTNPIKDPYVPIALARSRHLPRPHVLNPPTTPASSSHLSLSHCGPSLSLSNCVLSSHCPPAYGRCLFTCPSLHFSPLACSFGVTHRTASRLAIRETPGSTQCGNPPTLHTRPHV